MRHASLFAFIRACGGLDGSFRSPAHRWLRDLSDAGMAVGNVHSVGAPWWTITQAGRDAYAALQAKGKRANLCRLHASPRPDCPACQHPGPNLPPELR